MMPKGGWTIQGVMWDAFHCTDPEVLVCGPAGTGKTIADHILTAMRCRIFPGSRHLYVRQVRADLNDTIIPSFERVLGPNHPAIGDGCAAESRHRYEWPNGSVVVVAGLDRPQRTYSGEYDTVTVFEGTDTTEDSWQQFKRSLRHKVMPYQQLRMECNPDAPGHWIKKRADSGVMTHFKTTHKDNPAFWDEATQEWTPAGRDYVFGVLGSLTGFRRSRLLLGEWVGAEGVIYERFEPTREGKPWHVQAREFEPTKIVVGVDEGTSDPFVSLQVKRDAVGRLHVAQERYQRNLPTADKVGTVVDMRPDAALVDSAAAGLKLDIGREGVPTPMANKAILPGISEVSKWFDATIDGEPAITIDPGCANLIRELQSYAWNPGAAKEKPMEGNDHAPDALRYAIMHLKAPEPIVFEADELERIERRCTPPKFAGTLLCTHEGIEQDRALALQDKSCLEFERNDAGAVRVWTAMDGRCPRDVDSEYAMFVACGDGGEHRESVIVIADVWRRVIVADWARVSVGPERVARAACMLGLWFWGEKGCATIGVLRSQSGAVVIEHLQRLRYRRMWSEGGVVGWEPTPAEVPEAIGTLRAAWDTGAFAEVDALAVRDARQYVWKGTTVAPAWHANDPQRAGPWADRVIARAGLWRIMRTVKAPDPEKREPAWKREFKVRR